MVKVSISTQTGAKVQKAKEELDQEVIDQLSDNSADWENEKGYAKTFAGIPNEWHETIQVKNKLT